jgi:hypothetical protein
MVEIGPDAAEGAGVGLDGLGLQPLELELLEMGLVMVLEAFFVTCIHGVVTS